MNAVIVGRPTIYRSGIAYLLEQTLSCRIVCWCTTLQQAKKASAADVQLFCIDLEVIQPGSREANAIMQFSRQGAVIVYGNQISAVQKTAVQLISLGIAGILDVTRHIREIEEEMKRLAGNTLRKRNVSEHSRQGMEGSQQPMQNLTPREWEVMKLISQGETTKSIAHILQLSHHTVEFYRKRIMKKTGATSVALLTRIALRTGITFLWE